jgi:hypothetical protein
MIAFSQRNMVSKWPLWDHKRLWFNNVYINLQAYVTPRGRDFHIMTRVIIKSFESNP